MRSERYNTRPRPSPPSAHLLQLPPAQLERIWAAEMRQASEQQASGGRNPPSRSGSTISSTRSANRHRRINDRSNTPPASSTRDGERGRGAIAAVARADAEAWPPSHAATAAALVATPGVGEIALTRQVSLARTTSGSVVRRVLV